MRRFHRKRRNVALASALLAALTLALTLVPRLAHSELLLTEGAAQAPRKNLWQQLFDSVPAALRPTRDVVVDEVTDAQMDQMIRDDPSQDAREEENSSVVRGMFLFDEDDQAVIALRRSLAADEARVVFVHELGHLVWETHLSKGERRRYNEAYKRARSEKCLITAYAADSVEEGFAEAFSFYVRKPETLRRRDPHSYAALSEIQAERDERAAEK